MCTIYGILLHFAMFCCKISFFASYAVLSRNLFCTIYALLRGEKFSQKLYPWRKNDKYEVCGDGDDGFYYRLLNCAGRSDIPVHWSSFIIDFNIAAAIIIYPVFYFQIFWNIFHSQILETNISTAVQQYRHVTGKFQTIWNRI